MSAAAPAVGGPAMPRIPFSSRLLRIEWRRNPGIGLVVGFGLIGLAMFIFGRDQPVRTWQDTNIGVMNLTGLLRGIVAGVVAAVAARPRRHATGELVMTTARPAVVRELTSWGATALCGMLALVLVALPSIVLTTRQATWGGPDFWTFGLALLVMAVATAFGHAIGIVWSGRGAPVVVGVLLIALSIPFAFFLAFTSPSSYLVLLELNTSPNEDLWLAVRPDPALFQAAWLSSLLALFLAAIVALVMRTVVARRVVATVAVLTIVVGVVAWLGLPRWDEFRLTWFYEREAGSWRAGNAEVVPIPFDPVCEEAEPIVVCLHPAYAAALPEVSPLVNRIAEPVVGLAGVPTRFEQREYAASPPTGTVYFSDDDLPNDFSLPATVANNLVGNSIGAIGLWLRQRAGFPTHCDDPDPRLLVYSRLSPEARQAECDAAERFATLPPAEQRAWLAANIGAVRAGEVRAEEIPGGAS